MNKVRAILNSTIQYFFESESKYMRQSTDKMMQVALQIARPLIYKKSFFLKQFKFVRNDSWERQADQKWALRYRSEPYAGGDRLDEAMKWLLEEKHTYPHIPVVAPGFVCITGSQIESLALFSVLGVFRDREVLILQL